MSGYAIWAYTGKLWRRCCSCSLIISSISSKYYAFLMDIPTSGSLPISWMNPSGPPPRDQEEAKKKRLSVWLLHVDAQACLKVRSGRAWLLSRHKTRNFQSFRKRVWWSPLPTINAHVATRRRLGRRTSVHPDIFHPRLHHNWDIKRGHLKREASAQRQADEEMFKGNRCPMWNYFP